MRNESGVVEIDLLALAKALWHRAWAICISTILCGVLMFMYTSMFVTPLYEAETLLYVNNSSLSLGTVSMSITSADISSSKSLVDMYLIILKARTTLNEVIQMTGKNYTTEKLKSMITAKAVNSTAIFSVSVTSPDPLEAEEIANAIAIILPDKIPTILDGSSVRVVDYAVVPSSRISPSLTKSAIIGMLIGFVLACGILVLLFLLDDQVHTEDYLMETYESIPVLAVIPDVYEQDSHGSHYGGGYYGGYGYGYGYGYGDNSKGKKDKKDKKHSKERSREE